MSEALIKLKVDGATAAKTDINSVADAVKGLGGIAASGLAALGAGLSAVSFAKMVMESVESTAALKDLAIQTGASTLALSEFRKLGAYTETSIESIAGAMNKLAKNMELSDEASKSTGQALKALGIDFNNLRTLSPDEQLVTIAQAMDQFRDGAGKSAAAMSLFGKEGAKLLPFLKDLADESENVSSKLTEQEKASKESLAAMADNFSDNLQRMSKESKGWKKELTDGILPVLDTTAQAWLDVTSGPGGFKDEIKKLAADGTLKEWAKGAVFAVTYVMDVFSGLKAVAKSVGSYIGAYVASIVEGFSSVGDVISKLIKGDFEGASKEFQKAVEKQKAINEGLGESLRETWGQEKLGAQIRGRIEELEKAGAVAKAIKEDVKFQPPKEGDAAAMQKIASAYESITKRIREKLAESNLEVTQEKALTESQKLRIQFMNLVEQAHGKITRAQVKQTLGELEQMRSNEKARQTYELNAKALEKYQVALTAKDITDVIQKQSQAYLSMSSASAEYRESLNDTAELMELERSLMGASAEVRAATIEQFKVELELRKQIRRIRETSMSDGEKNDLERQARENAQLAKSQAAIKAQQDDWTKFYADIYNGLSDSLYRGFEAGKGFFQNFWDSIKNLFKTTVLKLAIQGVVGGVMGGLVGNANAASIPSAITSSANIFSAGKALWDGFASAGSSLTSFAGSSIGSLATLTGSNGGFLSSVAGGINGAGVGSGLSSSAGLSIGQGIASITSALPYIAAAAVLYRGLSMGDKQMTGQTITGNLGTDNLFRNVSWTQKGGFLRSDRSGTWSYGLKDSTAIQDGKAYQDSANVANDSAMLKLLNDSYAAIKASTADYAKSIGLNADSIANRNDALSVTLGATAEETNKAIQKALGSVADNIAASILPNFKDLAKEGETAATTLARVSTNFVGVNKLFGDLGLKLFSFGDAGIKASEAFLGLFGGLEQLNTVGASYYENFYTQQERTVTTLKSIGAEFDKFSLGSLPATREQYRALVEQISKTGSAEQLAAVLKLSTAFASVVPASDALTSSLNSANEAAKKAADTLAERSRLQNEYDSLTMSTSELLAKQRAALDETNRALFDSIQAEKEKQAAEADAKRISEESTRVALDRANAVAAERAGLQEQLNQLTLNESQLLALQREKLDDSNKALFDNVQALREKQAADQLAAQQAQQAALEIQQAAEKAAQAAASRAAEVANERAGLQDQLNQLTLTNAQLLQLQREKIDASNQALFDQVQAERARQAAVAEATVAAQAAAEQERELRAQRDQELKAAYQQWINDIKSAFDRESGIFAESIDQFTRLGDALNAYNDNLQTRSQSLLSPEAVYNASKSQFDTVASLARKGDQKALEQFQSVADAFLEASVKYNASGEAYFSDLENVKQATKDAAISSFASADIAKLQLTALQKQVSGLIDINESVKTVAQLLASGASGNSFRNSTGASYGRALTGVEQNILQALSANGGFDKLYADARKGDQYAGNVLANQLIRWSDWGLKQAEVDKLLGAGALQKVEDLFSVSEQMYAGKLTTWDGKNSTPIFSSTVTQQKTDQETIALQKETIDVLTALLEKTQEAHAANVAKLDEMNRRLTSIESNGALEAAR